MEREREHNRGGGHCLRTSRLYIKTFSSEQKHTMARLTVLLALCFALCVITPSMGITWRADPGIIRSLTVLQAPPLWPHTIEVMAAQLDLSQKEVDILLFDFSTAWVPLFKVGFADLTNSSVSLMSARWVLWKLVEYVESPSGNPGFEPGVDTFVGQQTLWFQSWSTLSLNSQTVGSSKVYSACTTLTGSSSLEVDVCIYVTNKGVNFTTSGAAVELNPNAAKYDLTIKNYPFQSNNSRLALKVSFDSNALAVDFSQEELDQYPSVEEEGAVNLAQDSNGRFIDVAWRANVQVLNSPSCGTSASVVKGVTNQGQFSADVDTLPGSDPDSGLYSHTVQVAYFSFLTPPGCQPSEIVWDPEWGGSVSWGAATSLAPSLMLLLLVLLALIVFH